MAVDPVHGGASSQLRNGDLGRGLAGGRGGVLARVVVGAGVVEQGGDDAGGVFGQDGPDGDLVGVFAV